MRSDCFFIFFCLFILSLSAVYAQTDSADSAVYKSALAGIADDYKYKAGADALLFTGREYLRNGQKANGFPFFESDSLIKGEIGYEGIRYSNIAMHYDLVNDDVVINNYSKTTFIRLVREKVNYFSFPNHYFVHILQGKLNGGSMIDGNYELLFNGPVKVFAKKEKDLIPNPHTDEVAFGYRENDSYFLQVGDIFYKINTLNSIMEAFNDKKEQIRKFIKTNNIHYKRDPEDALIKTARYYTQIKY